MATSGNFNFAESSYGSGTGYPCYAKIDWSATWNESSMLWTVNWSATAQGGSTAGRWATVFSGSVTVTDGTNTLQTKSMSGQIEQAKNNTVLLSGSFTVGTDPNGNRNLAFSGQFQFETTAASGKSSGSQTFALDQKAMASTISSVTQNVTVGSSGGAVTVNISRKSTSYTHTVKWTFGSHTATQTGRTTSASYTIPASWLSAIPNAASGTGTVTVTTFNGSTQVGTAVTASFTITAGVNPSIGSVSMAARGAAYSAGVSGYIAGYSTALITASNVAGVNGSTIKKVEFIRDGAVLSSNTTPTYTYTTGTLTGSSATFSVRVTDSRGRTATKSASAVTIQAYSLPAITANAFRSNSSGTATADGTYIRITASATATPSANSITALTYATKATTASSYSSEANIGNGVTASGFSNTTSYDVRVKATDKLGGVAYKYFTIPTASYTMDFKVGGKGVAFGKVAETDNLVDSAWNIKAPWFDGNWKFVREVNQADDLNTVIAFGKYAKYSNGSATKPSNCPTDSAFTLYIFSAQGSTEMNGAYKYGVQLIREFNNLNFYFRFMSTDGNGTLTFGSWTKYKMATADITRDTSTMSGIHLQKWENVVQLSIRGASINSSGSIGTFPSGYRPMGYMYAACMATISNNMKPAQLTIEADGTTKVVYFNGTGYSTATSGYLNGNVTFLVN